MNILSRKKNDPYKLENLKEEDILAAERVFGVKLPKEYIQLLFEQNGGELIYNALPVQFKNSWADDHIKCDHLLGIKDGQGIYLTEYLLEEWGIDEKNLIIISNNSHDWIVLDYRKENINPRISHLEVETGNINVVFKSFEEMISKLYTEEYDFDFSNFEGASLETAKKLCESEDKNEVVEGLNILVSESDDISEIVKYLFRFTQVEDEDIKYSAVNSMHNLITNNVVTDTELINSYLKLIKKDKNSDINYFYDEIKSFLN